MLQAIRDRVTGILAWVIVGLISVTFALWGVNYYLEDNTDVYAAKVNGKEITENEYRFFLQQQFNRMQARAGEGFDRSIINSPDFQQAVMDRLIEEELLVQQARKAGLTISDAMLASRIHADPTFQIDGEFSAEKYKTLLANEGISIGYFEHQLRRSLLIDQYLRGVSSTSVVPDAAVNRVLQLQNQQRDIAFLRIPASTQLDEVKVSDAEVKAYFEDNRGEFVDPQKVKLSYLELRLEDVRDSVEVDEAYLRELYESGQAEGLGGEEQRRARHILIQVEDADAPEAVAAARAEAQSLHRLLTEGGEFAELARQESDDPGSADKGGDLGFFARGTMVPAFEEVAFSLEEGEISEPVQSPFGFHIIQVTDIKAADKPAFDEVRDDLHKQATQAEAEQLFYERADRLSQLTFEIPDSLQPAADDLDMKIQTSGWITESGGEGIGQYPQVVGSAFSEDVLDLGNNSQLLEVEPSHAVVVRLDEHRAAEPLTLEAVEATIRERLQRQKAAAAAKSKGEALLSRLEQGEAMQSLATDADLELQTPGFVPRSSPKLDPRILQEAFHLPRRQGDQPVNKGMIMPNGDYLLLQVRAIRDGAEQQLNKEERLALSRNLNQMYGTREGQALVDLLETEAEIEISEDVIKK